MGGRVGIDVKEKKEEERWAIGTLAHRMKHD